jgi:hypothetical protein
LLEYGFGHAKSCSFGGPNNKRGCAFSLHSLKKLILLGLRSNSLSSGAGRFAFGRFGGSEVAVQGGVGGVENEVAIAAFGKMTLNLALDRWGQLSL